MVGRDVDGDTVADDGAPVDEYVFDAGRELAGLSEGGVVGDLVGFEDDDVREMVFANEASFGDLESGGGPAGKFGDDFLKREEFVVAHEGAEETVGGAEHAGVDVTSLLVDGIGADETAGVLEHGPAPGVFAFVKNEENRKAFLNQKIEKSIFGGEAGFGDVLAEQFPLMRGVFFAGDPGDVDFVEGEAVVVERAAEAAADQGIVEFFQGGERTIGPDLIGEKEVEHRRTGEVGVAVEGEVDIATGFIDQLQERLDEFWTGGLEVGNMETAA